MATIDPVMFDRRSLRNSFGQFATGVTIVTSLSGNMPCGMTANSFTSVSLDPALLLVCIDRQANMVEAIRGSRLFGVSVLGAHQQDISDHFARAGNQREIAFDMHEGAPLIPTSLAHFSCGLYREFDAGDHLIFLGEIRYHHHQGGDALLYHRGAYL